MNRTGLAGAVLVLLASGGAAAAERPVDRGLSVMVGGGVEGHSGDLGAAMRVGPAWGVTAGYRASRVLGVELGYSGSTADANIDVPGGAGDGADVRRNGGRIAAVVIAPTGAVEPYAKAGFGVSRYDVRHSANGLSDDTVSSIPIGAGVRTQLGSLVTLDAHVDNDFLLSQDVVSSTLITRSAGPASRYQALVSLGGTF